MATFTVESEVSSCRFLMVHDNEWDFKNKNDAFKHLYTIMIYDAPYFWGKNEDKKPSKDAKLSELKQAYDYYIDNYEKFSEKCCKTADYRIINKETGEVFIKLNHGIYEESIYSDDDVREPEPEPKPEPVYNRFNPKPPTFYSFR